MNAIGYVERTWNPISGCLPGLDCWKRCWARRMSKRLSVNPTVRGRGRYNDFAPAVFPERMKDPFHWRKGQRVAVGFMGDIALQTEDVIQQVAEVCAMTPQHTFLWLTKRTGMLAEKTAGWGWPRNVWLGTSVMSQADVATGRIERLLEIPTALHWVSVEPMVGPVKLPQNVLSRIDWIVAGPETGPKARECQEAWMDALFFDCMDWHVPFWDKRKGYGFGKDMPLAALTLRGAGRRA